MYSNKFRNSKLDLYKKKNNNNTTGDNQQVGAAINKLNQLICY